VPRRIVVIFALGLPAACTLATSTPSEGKGGACPVGMAHIAPEDKAAFCVDRWEASLVAITGKGKDRTEAPHAAWDPVAKDEAVKAVARAGVVPQGYISQREAEAACKRAKKRLCTGEEWETACRGKSPTTFPYGDERKAGYCNDAGRAPLASLYPDLGDAVYASPAAMNDPRINQAEGTVAKTGSFAKCKNAWGVFDMVGNLHEWVADVSNGHGTFRGGYYQDTTKNGDGCKYRTVAHDPSYHDYSTGFRCCADAR
jgi:formylglycine-generating enzyme required for sulfatase activity